MPPVALKDDFGGESPIQQFQPALDNIQQSCFPDHSNMYLRQQPTATMQQQPTIFNQSFQTGPQNAMMTSQAPNVPVSSWVNPNTPLSVETVTINHSGVMSHLPRPNSSRQQQQQQQQQQPNRGFGYSHRMELSNVENNTLPQLSMRDLQCLDTTPQTCEMNQSESHPVFHLQHQREQLATENRAQNHPGNHNQGLNTVWPSFNVLNQAQNTFDGSVPGGGGGLQGLGTFAFPEGMEGEDILKGLMGGASHTGFQLKQEPMIPVGQEGLIPSPRESQGNTYTNLLPRAMSNGAVMAQTRQDANQPLKNLLNPCSNNMSSEGHYPTLADWIKVTRQSD